MKPRMTTDPTANIPTPLPQLRQALANLRPGERVKCDNTKEEILRTKDNLMRRRMEINGADSHIEYIDALLVAESAGQLEFKRVVS